MVEKFSNLHLWLLNYVSNGQVSRCLSIVVNFYGRFILLLYNGGKILESASVAIKLCLEWTSEPLSIYSGEFLRAIYSIAL